MGKKARKLTIGMRCRFKDNTHWTDDNHKEYRGKECLLQERSSGGDFSVMVLGQEKLIKEDPKTVENEVAWVDEDCLEFVNAKFTANLNFMDWYQEHEDEFCGDCGAWFPNNGALDPATNEDYLCPNEKCPGRLFDSGICPCCGTPAPEDNNICPKCDFNWDTQC